MTNFTKHFVSNQNIPEFVKLDHELFDTFVKAYYEWLELQNDSESSSHSNVYKAVGNPAWLNNNQDALVDIDSTINEFIDFFANEVVPISLEGIQTNPRFFLKHIRDLYLAKGTIQSFKLFFKLYYNDEIDVFETGDNVLRVSDGKYFAFPTAHFYVTDFEDQLRFIDFTLASITDTSGNVVATVLDGLLNGQTPSKESILRIQLVNDTELLANTDYFIISSDGLYKIKVKALVSLTEITLTQKAPLYDENDSIFIESTALKTKFLGSVTSVTNGSVNGIKVRDKGVLYSTNDYFQFENDGNIRGRFDVTSVGNSGEILAVDNIPLKSGPSNNGWLANTLEDVYVTISNGGTNWKQLPVVKFNANSTTLAIAQPYPETITSPGIGFQSIALSSTIGTVNSISVNQETFFKDSDDVLINPPANVIVENNTLKVGDKVAFQRFDNFANWGPLIDDSDTLTMKYDITRLFGDANTYYVKKDSEIGRIEKFTFVYGFDSETFEWKTKTVEIDTRNNIDNIFKPVTDVLDSEGNVSYKIIKYDRDVQNIDGGLLFNELEFKIFHYYDSERNEIERNEFVTVYYKTGDSIDDLKTKTIQLNTALDSDMFAPIRSWMNTHYVGSFEMSENNYVDITLDGGSSFNFTTDSEIIAASQFNDSDIDYTVLGPATYDYSFIALSTFKIKYLDLTYDSEYDAGAVDFANYVLRPSENECFDGGDYFGFNGAELSTIEVEFSGRHLDKLEKYHFEQLDSLVGMDSETFNFSWSTKRGELNLATTDSDMGEWYDTGYYGEVVKVSHNNQVVKVVEYGGYKLPTQTELDQWNADKYSIVKISPVVNGVSVKDYSLPLTNVVHQIDRMEISFKTGVTSSLYRKFYSEDGFLSSDIMHLRDNYYYSDWSYRIKSKLPFDNWKQKFKTLLHPAGMVLTATYVQNLEVTDPITPSPDTKWSNDFLPNLTFDQNQEYIDTKSAYSTNADNIYYKSNGFEAKNLLTGLAKQLDGSSQSALANLAYKQQNGNAFWDYEPIGWVRKATVRVSAADTVNLDSETFYTNIFSTQDSDGNGFVKNGYTYYRTFNESKQDLYKNDSRFSKYLRANYLISKVQIEDADFTDYAVYDSELPEDFMVTFVDSDNNFNAIDYDRLKSENDSRYFSVYTIPRVAEIAARKEKDLRLAMRENKSLVWDDSDNVYYDYEAYERKWNQINNRRTRYIDGYSIKGFMQYTGYEHVEQRSNKRSKDFVVSDHKEYSTKITPLSSTAWNADTLIWYNTYYDKINTTYINHKYEQETYKDPQVSMRSRRGR